LPKKGLGYILDDFFANSRFGRFFNKLIWSLCSRQFSPSTGKSLQIDALNFGSSHFRVNCGNDLCQDWVRSAEAGYGGRHPGAESTNHVYKLGQHLQWSNLSETQFHL
jgi:hypothetical protein